MSYVRDVKTTYTCDWCSTVVSVKGYGPPEAWMSNTVPSGLTISDHVLLCATCATALLAAIDRVKERKS